MRILAHFEDGVFMEAFQDQPNMDPHSMIAKLIKDQTGRELTRTHVKNIGFGILYGMGVNSTAKQLGVDYNEAYSMIGSYHQALPGVSVIQRATKDMGRSGQPIVTIGGREYLAERPRIMKGEMRTFEYKLLNYLIQGSAADETKAALLRWFTSSAQKEGQVFLCTVHDEINISVPIGQDYHQLTPCMEATNLDVPMRCTIEEGPSWGEVK
jgi:DNA polymerase I-like protein with 3'-5' exonuclease and polymerase domains